MKEGWEVKKLGDVCNTGAGGTPLKTHKDYYEGGTIPWLLSGEVSQGEIIEAKNFITEKGLKNSSAKLFPPNTVLVAMYGATAGQVGILRFEAATNQAVCGILPNDKTVPEFLFYCFLSKKEELVAQAVGGAQPNISQIKIKNTKIPLPPLPEQQRIVSILDQAFAAIDKAKANAEQNLLNAKELFESYLKGVFENGSENWKNKTLGELCTFTQGIQRGVKLQSETQANGQVRFLRIVDYTQGNEPPRYIDHPGDKYILNEEDVALVRYGASTGFVCHGMEGALANNLFRVIPKSFEKLSNRFLAVYLKSPIFQDVIKSTMNGAAMPAISFGLIKEIPFPLPDLEEQQTIIQKISAVQAETQKLEAVYQKKMDDLEELKKSILQKAFAGELTETKQYALHDENLSLAAEPNMNKSRRDETIIENKMKNHNPTPKG